MGNLAVAFYKAIILILIQCSFAFAVEKLDYKQSEAFRSWFTRIVSEQLRQGPSPRWEHKDCAGLVRFGVYESMKKHDATWLKANGISNVWLPPEIELKESQVNLLNTWILPGYGKNKKKAMIPRWASLKTMKPITSRRKMSTEKGRFSIRSLR